MTNVKLIIFDFDGTIVDSAIQVLEVINQLRTNLGKSFLKKEDLISTISLGGEMMIQKTLSVSGDQANELLSEFRKKYRSLITPKGSVYRSADEIIKYFYEQGFKICICTNKPRVLVVKILKEVCLDQYIHFVCAGDDTKYRKPDVRIVDYCLDYFQVNAEQTILIGDSTVDHKLAMTRNIPFIWFKQGYNDGVDETTVYAQFSDYLDLKTIIRT